MKLTIAAMLIFLAMIVLTYLNMWQTKNIAPGKILNGEILRFLVWYGLVVFFFVNPMIVLPFRYCFFFSEKFMVPQLIYFATAIISPLIIAWLIFHETPARGEIAGTFFAILSVFCVIFWK